MIGKDAKIICLYVKSKTAFKTSLHPLSKLADQVKIRLLEDFKSFISKGKSRFNFFKKNAAPHDRHSTECRGAIRM